MRHFLTAENHLEVALVELKASGATAASQEVLDEQRRRGFVAWSGGRWELTAAGQKRAAILEGFPDIRNLMVGVQATGPAIRAVPDSGFNLTGGPATIKE